MRLADLESLFDPPPHEAFDDPVLAEIARKLREASALSETILNSHEQTTAYTHAPLEGSNLRSSLAKISQLLRELVPLIDWARTRHRASVAGGQIRGQQLREQSTKPQDRVRLAAIALAPHTPKRKLSKEIAEQTGIPLRTVQRYREKPQRGFVVAKTTSAGERPRKVSERIGTTARTLGRYRQKKHP